MAIIKKKQIKEMTHVDLINRLNELRLELVKEKGQIAIGGSPTNPGRIKETKKTIARILTELKRRGEKTA
ncbi:MAG: 50S ribosomal protein L29 [Candidatus Aenigmarchaeota archaeon]|nr:50S ribosomal protein L29 [Candidatus Aenigmarchaeota archaeon]